jgi:hypothetical protein
VSEKWARCVSGVMVQGEGGQVLILEQQLCGAARGPWELFWGDFEKSGGGSRWSGRGGGPLGSGGQQQKNELSKMRL